MIIDSRYDVFTFILSVRTQATNQWTSVTIRPSAGTTRKELDEVGQKDFDQFRSAEWAIPVQIAINNWQKWGRRGLRWLGEACIVGGTVVMSVLVRYVPGAPGATQTILESWVIPTIVVVILLILAGLVLRTWLDEKKQ